MWQYGIHQAEEAEQEVCRAFQRPIFSYSFHDAMRRLTRPILSCDSRYQEASQMRSANSYTDFISHICGHLRTDSDAAEKTNVNLVFGHDTAKSTHYDEDLVESPQKDILLLFSARKLHKNYVLVGEKYFD